MLTLPQRIGKDEVTVDELQKQVAANPQKHLDELKIEFDDFLDGVIELDKQVKVFFAKNENKQFLKRHSTAEKSRTDFIADAFKSDENFIFIRDISSYKTFAGAYFRKNGKLPTSEEYNEKRTYFYIHDTGKADTFPSATYLTHKQEGSAWHFDSMKEQPSVTEQGELIHNLSRLAHEFHSEILGCNPDLSENQKKEINDLIKKIKELREQYIRMMFNAQLQIDTRPKKGKYSIVEEEYTHTRSGQQRTRKVLKTDGLDTSNYDAFIAYTEARRKEMLDNITATRSAATVTVSSKTPTRATTIPLKTKKAAAKSSTVRVLLTFGFHDTEKRQLFFAEDTNGEIKIYANLNKAGLIEKDDKLILPNSDIRETELTYIEGTKGLYIISDRYFSNDKGSLWKIPKNENNKFSRHESEYLVMHKFSINGGAMQETFAKSPFHGMPPKIPEELEHRIAPQKAKRRNFRRSTDRKKPHQRQKNIAPTPAKKKLVRTKPNKARALQISPKKPPKSTSAYSPTGKSASSSLFSNNATRTSTKKATKSPIVVGFGSEPKTTKTSYMPAATRQEYKIKLLHQKVLEQLHQEGFTRGDNEEFTGSNNGKYQVTSNNSLKSLDNSKESILSMARHMQLAAKQSLSRDLTIDDNIAIDIPVWFKADNPRQAEIIRQQLIAKGFTNINNKSNYLKASSKLPLVEPNVLDPNNKPNIVDTHSPTSTKGASMSSQTDELDDDDLDARLKALRKML